MRLGTSSHVTSRSAIFAGGHQESAVRPKSSLLLPAIAKRWSADTDKGALARGSSDAISFLLSERRDIKLRTQNGMLNQGSIGKQPYLHWGPGQEALGSTSACAVPIDRARAAMRLSDSSDNQHEPDGETARWRQR